MANKQKLKRAYINCGYARHADILSLTYRFGIQGKCASYDLILAMSEASHGVIDKDAFFYTCKLNEVTDIDAYLVYCLEKRIFLAVEGGYTNSIVQKDQESYGKVLEADKERKRNRTGNKPESERKPDIDFDNDNDSDLVLDPKKNSPLSQVNVLTLPDIFQGDTEILKAVATWQRKLHEQGRTLSQTTLDAQLGGLQMDRARILAAIQHSVSKTKCLNLLEPPQIDGRADTRTKQERNHDISLETVKMYRGK